jgi:integrase
MRSLATRTTVGARALRWTILTAARTEETLEATWREITEVDGAPVWSLPGERMKAGLPHVVPLTPEMLAVLGEREADDQPLFRGGEGGFPNKGVNRCGVPTPIGELSY